MSLIRQLAYLVVDSDKLAEWSSYATDFLGMRAALDDDGKTLRIRMDARSYRFLLRNMSGGEASEDLWAAGFQVGRSADLAALAERIRAAGVEVHRGTPEECADRRVEDLIWLRDPQGLRIEIVYNPLEGSDDLVLPLVRGGFLTGDLGFGHIAIGAIDLKTCEAFYEDVLGFALSDYIVQDIQGFSVDFTFFHVNPRHHTLALAGLPTPYRLNHLMVEVADIDVVGEAMERAKTLGIAFYMNLGRHPNDRMLSFYAFTPSNFAVEFGTDGLQIDDDAAWQIKTYDSISAWGHKD